MENKNECCTTSDLDLTSSVPIQNGIEHSQEVSHNLITSIENSDVIDFLLPGTGDEYWDLTNSYLRLQGKVVKADGTDIAANSKVAPINNILNTAFEQLIIILNDVLVTPSNNLYPYKAMFEDILSHGIEAEQSYLTAAMYYKETAGKLDTFTNDDNESFKARKARTALSATFECQGRLHTELCHQLKPIINGVDIKIRLVRASDTFCIVKDSADEEEYKIKLTQASFVARKIKLRNDLFNIHQKELEKTPAVYPIKRVTVKAATVQKDGRDYRNETFYNGDVPNKLFFAFVLNSAFNGDKTKNPFNFQHFKVNSIAMYLDGQQIPGKPLTPDFENNLYTESYTKTIQATGTLNTAFGPNIKYEDFKGGYAIFGYDLTPDLSTSNTATKRSGKLQIEVKYKDDLSQLLSMVSYAENDSNIYIDRDRNVIFDYTS